MKYFLAVDIGASSGRHILGSIVNGKLELEEIYRFKNGLIKRNGHLCWDTDYLFRQIIIGMKVCKEQNKVPSHIGIDTWGVDFVLLDKNDEIVGDTVAYRDSRTEGMDTILNKYITEKELYKRTGIQKQQFNSIYQMLSIKEKDNGRLDTVKNFLMIPDYFNFLLTGQKYSEYTNATTTQLVNAKTYDWDRELVDILGCGDIFNELKQPGTYIGGLGKSVQKAVGYDTEVVMVASHDTASALMAIPVTQENYVYISSGTWSLVGTTVKEVIVNEESRKLNFTNSGGYDRKYLYLKNIMGLWLIQEVNREYEGKYSYEQWCDMASHSDIKSLIDCSDSRFLAPLSMSEAIRDYCRHTNQEVPIEDQEVAAVIYNSLAYNYKETIEELEKMSNKAINSIHIVGGGSKAKYLNKKTAELTGIPVTTGPIEASAIGNIICQMIAANEIEGINKAKEIIKQSFEIKTY